MCKHYIEIEDNKLIESKGMFSKGHFVICLECGILKLFRKGSKKVLNKIIARIELNKKLGRN